MAHYRKIDTRILLDKKYNQLSSDGRLVFLHLLIHPNLTSLGAMHASLAGIACELDWEPDRLRQAIESVHQYGMIHYDEKARFIWLPNFLKYNPPESPNVIKSWEAALGYLPECDLQQQLIVFVQQFVLQLSPAYQEALPRCFHLAEVTIQPIVKPLAEAFLGNPQPLPKGSCQNPIILLEGNLKNQLPLPEGILKNDLPLSEGILKNSLPLSEGILKTDDPLPEVLNTQQNVLINNIYKNNNNINIKYINNNSEKEEEIIPETSSVEKNNIEAKVNIVAPSRQKKSKPPDGEIVEVFEYWQHTLGHPQARLDNKRRKVITQALHSGYTVAQLQNAIHGCSLTPHNIGENEQGQRYDGLHVILRNADQIDRFIRNCHKPPRRRTVSDQLFADNQAAGDRWLAKKYQQAEKEIHAIN